MGYPGNYSVKILALTFWLSERFPDKSKMLLNGLDEINDLTLSLTILKK